MHRLFYSEKELWSDIFRCECLTRVCLHMCSCLNVFISVCALSDCCPSLTRERTTFFACFVYCFFFFFSYLKGSKAFPCPGVPVNPPVQPLASAPPHPPSSAVDPELNISPER